jgi:hypothetical protein
MDDEGATFHQQMTLVFGTLGAISFAALVLVLQNPAPFRAKGVFSSWMSPDQNLDAMVTMLALVSLLAIVSCVCSIFAGSGAVEPFSPVGWMGFITGFLSFCGLMVSVFDMVDVVTPVGSAIVVLAGFSLLFLFIFLLWRSMRKR